MSSAPDDLVDINALLACEDMRDLKPSTVRSWARRGRVRRYGWTRQDGKRLALYSLTEIRGVYRKSAISA